MEKEPSAEKNVEKHINHCTTYALKKFGSYVRLQIICRLRFLKIKLLSIHSKSNDISFKGIILSALKNWLDAKQEKLSFAKLPEQNGILEDRLLLTTNILKACVEQFLPIIKRALSKRRMRLKRYIMLRHYFPEPGF